MINTLEIEVKDYEPKIALDGGDDGLKFYRVIFDNVVNFLNPNGKVYMEIGYNQGDKLREMFNAYNYKNFKIIRDLSDNDRVITFTM